MGMLVDQELAGVTFIRDYVQLLFDGPTLNLYVWPSITTQEGIFEAMCGNYKNVLCNQIGRKVIKFDYNSTKIDILFDNNVNITVYLSDSNKRCAEFAALWDGKEFTEIWR